MFSFFWEMDVIVNLIKEKNMEVGCKYRLNQSGVFLAGSFEFYTVV